MKTIVGIVGTTCVGKSDVAVRLAQLMNTEVISADAMQIYKGMDIGTAKITESEMQGITHHMLSVVQPNQQYTAYDYQLAASQIVDNMQTIPIVAGGTGLYINSLLYPPEYGCGTKKRRQELQRILQTEGLPKLVEMLKSFGSEAYNNVDLHNPVRVVRALEIAESGYVRVEKQRNPRYDCKLFVLQRDRNVLYEMIDARVDKMIKQGLVDEVKALLDTYGVCDTSAFAAIGYKEIIAYLQGKNSLAEAVAQIKLNTRHYAKRQITYIKKMNVLRYIDVDNQTTSDTAQQIYDIINKIISEN